MPDPTPAPPVQDPAAELSGKLDAILKALDGLKPKEDSKPPADPLLESTLAVLRDGLDGAFPKEDVAKMGQQELVLAHKLKRSFKPKQDTLPPPPTAGQGAPPATDPYLHIAGYYAVNETRGGAP